MDDWTASYAFTLNKCKCCNAELHEIDPENICMECVDMGCKVEE